MIFNKTKNRRHGKFKTCLFLILISIAFLVPSVLGVSIGTFKQNTDVELYQTCNNCTYCNITAVKYPNSTNILTNVEMIKDGTYYSFFLDGGNTSALGTYQYCYDCGNAVEIATGCIDFEITPAGIKPTTAQGGLSIGILFSIILLMFFFGWLSFKFMETDKGFPVGLFFLLVSIIISVYGLYLGVIFSRDYLYSNVADVQSKIFIGIMYGLVGMMFFGLLTLTIMAVKEIKERKSIQKYGENYDTKTKTYRY